LLKVALLGSEWVMWLLLLLSVASIGSVIERWWFFRKHTSGDELGDELCALLEKGDAPAAEQLLATHGSIEASVLARAIRWVDGGADSLADSIQAEITKKRKELERGLTFLGTLGNNAPFIGLFGTVIGVIIAFHQLQAGQDKAAMGNVMAGIAEALVATGVGLFVAIPAVVAYNIFQKKVGDVEANVEAISKQLTSLLKAAEHARSRGTPGGDEPKAKLYERAPTVEETPTTTVTTAHNGEDATAEISLGRLGIADSLWDGVE
jgi:biopolymer transport protein ExbB/biopolymer transport protein TolQ